MSIMMPEKKQSTFSKLAAPIGAIAGGTIGTVVAPGAGTAMGASLGGALGNTAVGVANKNAGQALGGVAQGAMSAGGSAMERRLAPAAAAVPQGISVSEQTKVLGEGAQAMSDLAPELQEKYGQTVMGAYRNALRRDFNRGME